MPLAEGQLLEDKYVITRHLADGGMSTVYLGVNRRIGKDVAVKVLHPGAACLPEVVERFEREARIVSRIRSAHVADVYDFGELPTGERFMVMEYLEGESLASLLERERTLPSRTLAVIALQILSALCAAHAAGVVHRDLKPENVIVTTRGKETLVKVVDFGISKCVDVSEGAMRRTAADTLMGTPLYMSPEQARGNTALIDERSDIYALGVMLYEAASGEPPIMGENVQELLFRIATEEAPALDARVPGIDPALAAIVQKAMQKDPAQRFATADDMLRAVEDWRALFASGSLTPITFDSAPLLRSAPPAPLSVHSAATFATPLALGADIDAGGSTGRGSFFTRHRRALGVALAAPLVGLLFLAVPTVRSALRPPATEDFRVSATADAPAAAGARSNVPALPGEPAPVDVGDLDGAQSKDAPRTPAPVALAGRTRTTSGTMVGSSKKAMVGDAGAAAATALEPATTTPRDPPVAAAAPAGPTPAAAPPAAARRRFRTTFE